MKKDQVTGVALILLGITVTIAVNQFRVPFRAAYPGPRLFPLISAFGFVICGLGIFVQGLISKKEDKVFLSREGWLRIFFSFTILAAYVFFMMLLGYMIVTPFALYAITTLFAKGARSPIKNRIIFSVVLTLFIYVMYIHVFGLTLPKGNLF